MESQKYAKTASLIGYYLFIAALLSIVIMSLSDYTAETVKLEKVRREYRKEYCSTLTADIYKCAQWQAEAEKSK